MQRRALEFLQLLDSATSLLDLRYPGLRLEALSGNRVGYHSMRITRQWRVVFRWEDGNAYGVQIVDYH